MVSGDRTGEEHHQRGNWEGETPVESISYLKLTSFAKYKYQN